MGVLVSLVLRPLVERGRDDLIPVAINDLGSVEANAHLFRYDSVHGRFPGEVEVAGNSITIHCQGRSYGPIRVSAEKDPTKVPFQGVDVAMECTGHFTKKETAAQLVSAGARKVLISAPADSVDATIVYGVNEKTITRGMTVISNASCTTNCLAPIAKVLHDAFGIVRGYMVTVHAYTGDQRTIDTLHKDLHRARAAAVSMIPTSTGAARSVGLVIPELKGKLDGTAIRVPTPNVSLVSLDVVLKTAASATQINDAMKAASRGPMRGIQWTITWKSWSASISTILRCRALSMRRRPRSSMKGSPTSSAGTTMNGPSPAGCWIPPRSSAAFSRSADPMRFRTLDQLDARDKKILLRG